ncbi:hypothetical protein AQS8620_01012 [Aquimixticola soesokkakensis]|uniref:Uncharacterized protein n=1 Tax=Aquimixticola soesokkakensis TaxID=1519096 RepID=A0A1Y5S2S9_9RHOB|nr:hypothetical protein [Aquimixticola soesokkakensis]SLN31312.1 hypothetical protein AQS8620_01012 [Aquimixticola soesokkakensis]
MLELRSVWFGPEGAGWLDRDDDHRYDTLTDLRDDHPLGPMQQEGLDARMLFAEIVLLDAGAPVGTAMLVVDPDAHVADFFDEMPSDHEAYLASDYPVSVAPARIVNFGLKPDYRTEFVITSLEDALVELGNLDPGFEEVAGHNGRRIPIPDAYQQAACALRPLFAN